MSLSMKRPSLFDVRFLMHVLGNVYCQHIHRSQIRCWLFSVICRPWPLFQLTLVFVGAIDAISRSVANETVFETSAVSDAEKVTSRTLVLNHPGKKLQLKKRSLMKFDDNVDCHPTW